MGKIYRAVAADGNVKIAVIEARGIVERARQIHGLSATATAALGRELCAASILGNMLKEENGTLTMRVSGGGIAGNLVAVSDSSGNVRGYMDNPKADLPTRADGKLDVGGIVGRDGTLTISRDIGLREPYVGSTELVSGEIAEDLARYLAESDQIGAACGLGVLVDTDLSVKAAGGFIVELLPGAPDELAAKLEENITMMDQLTTILDEDGPEEVISQVLHGLEPSILEECEVSYRCSCSRERITSALVSLGGKTLGELADEGEAEVNCQFCGETYRFSPEELRALAGKCASEEKTE